MSQPLLYVSPEDGQVYKVRESEQLSLESIDDKITHHQNCISELNVERQKFLELTTVENAGAETPAAPAATDTASAPADAPSAPADNQAAPAAPDATSGDEVATPPIAA